VRALERDEGMLIRPASSIHTCFMRFPIDVVFLDRGNTVVAVREDVRPWRLAWTRRARAVLELPAGRWREVGLGPGVVLQER
jgi:uncharacterized membrane protein (UPF0127 family)